MGQFLYFVPKAGVQIDADFLERVGLADRLTSPHRVNMTGPPDGEVGLCFCAGPQRLRYEPADQTWVGPFEAQRYWIGYWRDDRPAPPNLARARQVSGGEVELLDGNRWLVPSARLAPTGMVVRAGAVEYRTLAAGERLWRHAEKLLAYYRWIKARADAETDIEPEAPSEGDGDRADRPPISDADALGIIADALAINYRISANPAEELSALELISTQNMHEVFATMIGLLGPEGVGGAKKNDASPT